MWPAWTRVERRSRRCRRRRRPAAARRGSSTLSEAPPAPSSIEKPLAFQKRVASVSRTWLGALTKGSMSTSPAGGQADVLDLADLDALVEHRRADGHRAAVGRAQPDAQARLVGGGERRPRQALEAVLRRADLVVPEGLDVDAGDHRLDAGDALGGDAGADHPELGVGVDEVRDVLVDAGGDDDLREVLGEVESSRPRRRRRRGSAAWSGRPRRRRRSRRRSRSAGRGRNRCARRRRAR